MGRRFRPRERPAPRPRRPPGEQHPALHLRVAFRAPQDLGPLHHAGRAGTGRAPGEGPALASDSGPRLDVRENLPPAARLSGWTRRASDRPDGGFLHFPEILQSEKHELMRILHLDAGKEMRGGQWQALRLVEGLAAAGVESTLLARRGGAPFEAPRPRGLRVEPWGPGGTQLLARRGGPLFEAARQRGLRVEPWGLVRTMLLARRHDLVHAHDGRSHTLG